VVTVYTHTKKHQKQAATRQLRGSVNYSPHYSQTQLIFRNVSYIM